MFYVKQGKMPDLRHTFDDRKNLLREELFGEESFEGPYSLLYHKNEPTEVHSIMEKRKATVKPSGKAISHKHFRSLELGREGSFITGRKVLMYNNRLSIGVIQPELPMEGMQRNALSEFIGYIHSGSGTLVSPFGNLRFGVGDYLYIPKGLTFFIEYSKDLSIFYMESADRIGIPQRYLNIYGQIKEGSPYYTRDFRYPLLEKPAHPGNGKVFVDYGDRFIVEDRKNSIFDVVGWDGYLYPFAVNVERFSPIVGKLHMPPPVHEHFCGKSFMLGTFLPRLFDFHPKSVPISYYHNNIDVDEVLFYSTGNFMSRKGIAPGSITVHVRGIIHGPQPGAVEGAIGKKSTDEVAVMIEAYDPLKFTEISEGVEDTGYMMSWKK